jgi:hypothetical protein
MDRSEAEEQLRSLEEADRDGRIARLQELTESLPSHGFIGFSGQAGQWLFEDVKATWLYGCFAATVVTAAAFCKIQLAESIRFLPDDDTLPSEPVALDALADIAAAREIISTELQAQFLMLNDRAAAYQTADLHLADLQLERHLNDARIVGDDDSTLLEDARLAMKASIAVLFRS